MARRPVDEKIIKLTMDNSDLSEKAAKSVELINKLKDTLNKIPGVNIGKAGDNIAKIGEEAGKSRVGLAAVADGVDQIASRFSNMGIVGTEVLRRVTNTGLDLIGNLAKKAWNQTVTAGKNRAKNIEQAAFQFKGLGMDVEKAMAAANYATTGTTFGLDEAALAASALGASGIEAGDDMATALRSIAGVAAMTNSSYSDTARIFTTVAGQGRLMSDQLNQFASRGLNVAAMMAKEFGVTETQLREMVTKGKVSFTDFYQTMDKLFGEHAISNRQTFDGAMSAMKSSFTRIGETLWVPILTHSRESLLSIMTFFNELHNGIKPIVADLEPYVEKFFRSFDKFISGIDLTNFGPTMMALYNGVMNIGTAIGRIIMPIINAFRALVGIDGSPIYGLAKAFEWLTSKLVLPLKVSELLETVLTSITSTVNSTVMAVINGVSRVITALQDIPGLIDKFTTKFVEGAVAAGKWMGNVFINIPVSKIKEFGEYLKTLNAGEWLGNFITNIPFEKLGEFGENLTKLAAVFEDQFFVKDNNLLWSINNTLRIALEALGVNFEQFDKAVNRIEKAWTNFIKIFEGIDLKDTFSAGFLGGMASLISQIITNIDRLTDVGDFVRNIGTELDKLATMFREKITDLNQNVFPAMWAAIEDYLSQLKLSTESLMQFIKDLASLIVVKLTPAWEAFVKVIGSISLEPLLVAFRELGRFVMNIITPIWNLIKDIITNITWEDVFAGGFLVGIGMILDNMKESFGGLKEIWDKITGLFSSADGDSGAGPVSDFLESIAGSLSDFSGTMQESVSIGRIVAVATAVGILAASMHALSGLDTQQIANGMAAIASAMLSLSYGMKALDFINLQGVGMAQILAFALAIRILVGALKQVSDLDPSTVGQGILAIGTSTFVLSRALKALDEVKLTTAPGTIIAMGLLIKMLVSSLKSMEGMSGLDLLQNASTIGLLALEMAAFGKIMDNVTVKPSSMVSMLLLSGVIKILVNIMDDINNVEGGTGGIITSVATIGALLGVLGAFAKMTNDLEIKPSTGIAVMGIAAALIMLIKPVKSLAEIDSAPLISSIAGIGALLSIIAMFSEKVKPDDLVETAAGTALIAGALTLLIIPVKQLGEMDLEDLAQGLGAVTLLMAGLSAAMLITSKNGGGGKDFILMAVGLTMLLVPIKQLGEMEWRDLLDSLAKFAITVGVIAGVSMLLQPAVPAIAALAGSLITLGGALALIGISMTLLGAGLSILAALTVATITGAVASIGVFLIGLTKLIPTVGKLLTEILSTVIDVVLGLVDQFVRLVVEIIYTILRAIRDHIGEFINIAVEIIVAMMHGIRDNAHMLLDAAIEMIVALIDGMADALNEHGPELVESMRRLVGAILVIVIDALVAILTTIFGWIPGFEEMVSGAGDKATEALREHFDLETPTSEQVGKAMDVVEQNTPGFAQMNAEMAQDARDEYTKNYLLEDHTEEEAEAIISQLHEHKQEIIDGTTAIGDGATTGYIDNLLIDDYTGDTLEKINKHLMLHQSPLKKTAETVGSGMSTGYDNNLLLSDYTGNSLEAINKQLEQSKTPLKNKGADAGGSVTSGFKTNNFSSVGGYATAGIRGGLSSTSGRGSSLWTAAANVGSSVLSSIKIAMGVRSPSIYTREAGVFFVEGLTLGMESMMGSVNKTAGGIGNLALDATNNALDAAMSEFDSEVRVKVLVDTSELDNWVNNELGSIRPNTSFVNRMADASRPNTNQNEDKMYTEPKESNEYNYDVHIHATGELPRATIRRMAHQFKDEIDTIDRRSRMNRGEEVVY